MNLTATVRNTENFPEHKSTKVQKYKRKSPEPLHSVKNLPALLHYSTASKYLSYRDVHKLKLFCFVFECRNRLPLKPSDNYFISLFSIHNHNTRQAFRGDLFVPRINTTQCGEKTASYAGSVLWNDLPHDLRNSPSSVVFKGIRTKNPRI